MRYNAVIFDLDGTLLNTLEDLHDSVGWVLEKHSFPACTLAQTRSFVGNGIERLVRLSVPEGTQESIAALCIEEFKTHYAHHSRDKTAPYPGIIELLSQLKAMGVKTGIVSNKLHTVLEPLCDYYFTGLIGCAVGEREGVPRKPSPECVFEVMRVLGCDVQSTLYVGDSDVDMLTAKNAKLDSVGVLWGFRDKCVLQSAGADYTVECAHDVINIVKGE